MRLNSRSRHLSKAERKRKERILATRSEQDVRGNRGKGLTKAAAEYDCPQPTAPARRVQP